MRADDETDEGVTEISPDDGGDDAAGLLAALGAGARARRAAAEAAAAGTSAATGVATATATNPAAGASTTVTVVEGFVAFVPFADEASGFRVLRVRIDDGGTTTVVGKSGRVAVGDRVRAVGVMEVDAKRARPGKHGRNEMQLKATEIAAIAPVDEEGLALALARCAGGGAAPGFGPGRARAWIRAVGGVRIALEMLADPACDGSAYRICLPQPVVIAWRRQIGEREADAALATLGLPPGLRRRIIEKHGAASAAAVRADPYAIAREVEGVGWAAAERIAASVGIEGADPRRARGAVAHALERAGTEDGHTALDASALAGRAAELAGIDLPAAERARDDLVEAGGVARLIRTKVEDGGPSSRSETLIADRASHEAEAAIAAAFRQRTQEEMTTAEISASYRRDESWPEDGDRHLAPAAPPTPAWAILSDEQRDAARAAVEDRRHVITGAAGVGKTTVLRAIVEALDARGDRYALCAPTARAARRMAEATGRPAATIHRMLGFGRGAPGSGSRWEYHAGSPLQADVVLADESSMIDSQLMATLVAALRPGARLILMGDPNQLSPVGPGDPFRDLIDSGAVPTSRLTRIYRQAAASRIVTFARGLLDGRLLAGSPPGDRSDGCLIRLETSMSSEAAAIAVDIYCEEVARAAAMIATDGMGGMVERDPTHLGAARREDVIVLSPMRRGACGVEAINAAIQARVNPARAGVAQIVRPGRSGGGAGGRGLDGAGVERGGSGDPMILRVGDRARQTRNDYDLGVVNGELGEIAAVEARPGRERVTLRVDDGREVEYDREQARDLTLAYAGTVHAGQGSQWPVVIVTMARDHWAMATRSLLYTAVTRASRACVLVGDRRTMEAAARDRRAAPRTTMLRAMMVPHAR